MKEAPTLLGQLGPRLNRSPLGFDDPLAGLVPPTEPIGANPKSEKLAWDALES
jgi:hypothetical protein